MQSLLLQIKKMCHYDPDLDTIHLVVDRDCHSFTKKQYDEVSSGCIKNNIRLYVTNPCIELFLLFHHRPCHESGRPMILLNQLDKPKGDTFTCRLLKKKDIGYAKESYDAGWYVDRYEKAKGNAEKSNLATSIEHLKDSIGTNLFELCDLLFSLES